MDTSIKRKLRSVPLVSVLERFGCNFYVTFSLMIGLILLVKRDYTGRGRGRGLGYVSSEL